MRAPTLFYHTALFSFGHQRQHAAHPNGTFRVRGFRGPESVHRPQLRHLCQGLRDQGGGGVQAKEDFRESTGQHVPADLGPPPHRGRHVAVRRQQDGVRPRADADRDARHVHHVPEHLNLGHHDGLPQVARHLALLLPAHAVRHLHDRDRLAAAEEPGAEFRLRLRQGLGD